MPARSGGKLLYLGACYQASAFAYLILTGDRTGAALSAALALVPALFPKLSGLAFYSTSVLVPGLSPPAVVLRAAGPALALASTRSSPTGEWASSKKLAAYAALFLPVYIAAPARLLAAAFLLAFLGARLFVVLYRLGRLSVEPSTTVLSGHVGELAELVVTVRSPSPAWLRIELEGGEAWRGAVKGAVEIRLAKRLDFIGVRELHIAARACDLDGYACASKGPFAVRAKSVPKYEVFARRAEAVLRRALETLPRPLVLVRETAGELRISARPRGVGEAGASSGGSLGAAGGGPEGSAAQPRAPGAETPGGRGGAYEEAGPSGEGAEIPQWKRPLRVLRLVKELFGRSPYGDYLGARDYVPGDPLRSVHWKKTASRGKLVVKEFSRSGLESEGGGGEALVIADWLAANYEEMDKLVVTTLSAIAYGKRGRVFLYLRLPSGREYFISGESLEALAALVAVLRTEELTLRWFYEPIRRDPGGLLEAARAQEAPPLVRALVEVNSAEAERLVRELEDLGVPPNVPFMVISGSPTVLKYSVLAAKLSERGRRLVSIRPLGRAAERAVGGEGLEA